MTHDPLCYMTDCTHPDPHGDFKATCGHCTAYCVCDFIAQVRSDEQMKAASRVMSLRYGASLSVAAAAAAGDVDAGVGW